jgi:hypothetical protein
VDRCRFVRTQWGKWFVSFSAVYCFVELAPQPSKSHLSWIRKTPWAGVRHGLLHRVARFSWYKIPKRENIPNGHKIYKIALKYAKSHKIYQHLPLQDPTVFTQIGIFGLKIYPLATLLRHESIVSVRSTLEKSLWLTERLTLPLGLTH